MGQESALRSEVRSTSSRSRRMGATLPAARWKSQTCRRQSRSLAGSQPLTSAPTCHVLSPQHEPIGGRLIKNHQPSFPFSRVGSASTALANRFSFRHCGPRGESRSHFPEPSRALIIYDFADPAEGAVRSIFLPADRREIDDQHGRDTPDQAHRPRPGGREQHGDDSHGVDCLSCPGARLCVAAGLCKGSHHQDVWEG